jgi:hypothetical protein
MIVAPAITISVSPPTVTVSNSQSTPVLFTADIGNDVSLQGTTWTLSQAGVACPTMPIPTCGTLFPTASNTQINYYAPAAIPTPATVVLTATSVADNTKSATATITVAPPAISVVVSPSSPTVTDGDQDTSLHPGHAQIVLALTGL